MTSQTPSAYGRFTRRDAIASAGRLRASEATESRLRTLVDIVGCGAVVRQFHLPALRWLERLGLLEVRYCLDPNRRAAQAIVSRLRRARPISVASPSDIDVDGAATVLVATPPEQHYDWARHYLQAGAHVLLEKPAVLTMQQFSSLKDAARMRQRVVLVGHIRRLYPSVNAAREVVRSGRIGRVRRVDALAGDRWNWTTQSDFPISSPAGGVVYDFGSHLMDMALFISGFDHLEADSACLQDLRVERWPAHEPSHQMHADFVLRASQFMVPFHVRLSRRMPLANLVRVQGEDGEVLVDLWYRRTALVRANGAVSQVSAEPSSIHTTTAQGCFVAEHLELWRTLALPGYDSPLALAHAGLLTRVLETLAGRQTA